MRFPLIIFATPRQNSKQGKTVLVTLPHSYCLFFRYSPGRGMKALSKNTAQWYLGKTCWDLRDPGGICVHSFFVLVLCFSLPLLFFVSVSFSGHLLFLATLYGPCVDVLGHFGYYLAGMMDGFGQSLATVVWSYILHGGITFVMPPCIGARRIGCFYCGDGYYLALCYHHMFASLWWAAWHRNSLR